MPSSHSSGNLGGERQVGRVPFGRVALGPGDDRGDFLLGERADVAELGTDVRVAFHGGIDRSSTTAAMSDARLRACS